MKNTLTTEGKKQIQDRLEKLTPDTAARWGTMTVNQMLAHMNDAHKIALGMKPAADKSNFYTSKIMFPVAVYLMPSWPKGEKTAPELDQKQEGTKAKDFYTELEFLYKMMDIFAEREESKLHPHPMFGKLSKKQWSDLLYKHFDHHLRQFGV
ncbi:MAG: DUF1569 domain-containing protein [Bacteroidetes bacterium]|nr:DUF1569 domain-containing protein [Bacteroidota bacterium]